MVERSGVGVAVVLVGVVALLMGCSAGGEAAEAPVTSVSATTVSAAPSAGDEDEELPSDDGDDEYDWEACRTARRNIATAVEAYYAKIGRYPADVDQLDEDYLTSSANDYADYADWTIDEDGTLSGSCP